MTNLYNPGPEYGPSSGYGPRNPSQAGASKFHYGNDYRAPLGTPIRAAADGKVWYTGAASGYDNVVILKHEGADGAPYFTVYGHMNELPDLTKGQPVDAGQEIGKVGNKGISSGPHLHFETVDGDTKFNNKINGSGTGVEGWVNRVNPNTFDFHGNKVYNGAGNSIASPAQPSTAPPSNSPARATQPSPAGNSPTRAPISPNAPPQTVYDSWNPFDPAPMNPGSIGPFSTGGRILSGHQPLYPTESFVPASPGSFADHYSKWGTVPLPNAPAASDDPANFAGRFGSWASSPAGALGDFNRPPPQPVPNQGKRSDVPDGVTPDATQATPAN